MNEIDEKLNKERAENIFKELVIDETKVVVVSKQLWSELLDVLKNFNDRLNNHFERLNQYDKRIFKLEEREMIQEKP